MIDFSDILPTFVELAGGKLPENYALDGHSFAPLLLGKPFRGRQWIYSPLGQKQILRDKHELYEGDSRFFDCGTSATATAIARSPIPNSPLTSPHAGGSRRS